MQLSAPDIQVQLSRRRPGQSNLTTPVCTSLSLFLCLSNLHYRISHPPLLRWVKHELTERVMFALFIHIPHNTIFCARVTIYRDGRKKYCTYIRNATSSSDRVSVLRIVASTHLPGTLILTLELVLIIVRCRCMGNPFRWSSISLVVSTERTGIHSHIHDVSSSQIR